MDSFPAAPADRILRGEAFDFFRGRVAMFALLEAMGIGAGDEVIIQAFTCLAVPAPILAAGATPVYVDVATGSLNMDPAAMRAAITSRTRAIVVQHSFGMPADLEPLLAIARSANLYVIEDCAHTFAATYDGRTVGTFGDAAFHSFEWGKPVVIGIGGTALVNDPALETKIAAAHGRFGLAPARETLMIELQYAMFQAIVGARLYWSIRDAYRYLSRSGITVGSFRKEEWMGHASADYSRRMAFIHRHRLKVKLGSLALDTARRERLAAQLSVGARARGLRFPVPSGRAHPVYIKFPIRVGNKASLLARARRDHVELYDMFVTPVHPLQPAEWGRVGYRAGACPRAESLAEEIVSVPLHHRMTARRIERTLDYLSKHAEPSDG